MTLPKRGMSVSSTFSEGTTQIALAEARASTEQIRADIPVPDHSRDSAKEFRQLRELKLSQRLGILLFCNRLDKGNGYVLQRINFLQEHASIEAIQAGIKFYRRMVSEPKLQKDFKHVISYYLYNIPQTLEYHKRPKNRIRGYRDKGTLPDQSVRARAKAGQEGWFDLRGLENQTVREFLEEHLPDTLIEGDFLDLPGAIEYLQEEELILERLRKILLQL